MESFFKGGMFSSIKSKVIITYSLVIIFFTTALILITFFNQRDHVLDLGLEESLKISKLYADLLNKEFAQSVAMLKMVSDEPQVKSGNVIIIKKKLNRLLEVGNGIFINAIYVDKDFLLTDATGKLNKVTNPLFVQGKQWEGKEYNISVPILSKFQTQPVIMVAVPIRDINKDWIGTIAVAVPLSIISDKLSSIKLEKGSYAWLTDPNSTIASHPNKQYVMKSNLNNFNKDNFPGLSEIFQRAKLQSSGYGRYSDSRNKVSKIVTFSKIDYLSGWNLFVTTNESEIFEDVNAILFEVLITSVILMVIFLFLVSQLSNRITKPIIQLTKAVKSSIRSKVNHFEIIYSNDEIGQLSQAFSTVFYKMHLHTNHLKELVDVRTKEISAKNKMLSEQNERLEELASKDPLTGCYNRRAFNLYAEAEMSRAKRHNSPVTLVILDVDYFKKINDLFGHNVGDKTLCRLAMELIENTRKENIICRWGGEEFVMLIPEATSKMLFKYLDEFRERISQLDFSPVERLTVSIGMATLKPEETFEQWFKRADNAMYKAKESGRNCVIEDNDQ